MSDEQVTRLEVGPSPAFAGKTPRILTPSCHDLTPFLDVACPCGSVLHLHESQIEGAPPDAVVVTRCHGCGRALELAGAAGAFDLMRAEGWLAPREPPRDPSVDRTPLDLASFWLEQVKFGDATGEVELTGEDETLRMIHDVLSGAGAERMTAAELRDALEHYVMVLTRQIGGDDRDRLVVRSLLLDGLLLGVAYAAGLEGEPRNPRR